MLTFSAKQNAAIDQAVEWLENYEVGESPQVFRIFGFAGTGKTTIVRAILERVKRTPRYMAFSGKAANVMRQRGCEGAKTIHKTIYTPVNGAEAAYAKLEAQLERETDPARREMIEDEMNRIFKDAANPRFILNLEAELNPYTDVIVLDEVSMVDEPMGKDVLAFNCPVLVMGDPGQLPPIKGTGYFTECAPDVMLTEVFRQAEGNPILDLATKARKGEEIEYGEYGSSSFKMKGTMRDLIEVDQVIVGTNARRISLNKAIRNYLGRTKVLEQGDKIIITKNNYEHEFDVLNGQLYTVERATYWKHPIGHEFYKADLVNMDEPDLRLTDVLLHLNPFVEGTSRFKERWLPNTTGIKRALVATYGYAITCHKAQGSQWNKISVVNDWPSQSDTYQQWLYTALTRAVESVTLMEP